MAEGGTSQQISLPYELPGEVIDKILDHLHGDTVTLKTCTLVCRAWIPTCRYHLFTAISCHPAIPGEGITELLEWALASPDVVPYVEWLYVSVEPPPLGEEQGPTFDVAVEDLVPTFASFPNIRSIVLMGISMSSRTPLAEHYVPPTIVPPLDMLFIVSCSTTGGTFYPMYRLLSFFSEIGNLNINDPLDWMGSWDPSMALPHLISPLQSRLHVHGFQFESSFSNSIAQAVLHLFHTMPRDHWELKTLSFCVTSAMNGPFLELIEDCKHSLTYVYVNVCVDASPDLENISFGMYYITRPLLEVRLIEP